MLAATDYTVCTQGPPACQFTKIQEAIDAVPEGATIVIKAGTYEENLLIRKSLTIQAAEGEEATIKSATESLPALLLVSGRPIQVSVTGLTIMPAHKHQGNGVEILGTVAARLERNTIQDHNWGGFVLGKPERFVAAGLLVSIRENTIRDNHAGIMIWRSDGVTVAQNKIQSKPSSPEDLGGVAIFDSKQVVVSGNSLEESGLTGVWISGSTEIQVVGNMIKRNPWVGILVSGSEAELSNNQVGQNGQWGVAVVEGARVSLTGNRITHQEGYGLGIEWLNQVSKCQSNEIRENKEGDYLVQAPLFSFFQPRRDLADEEELRKQCERS